MVRTSNVKRNVALSEDLHRQAKLEAFKAGKTLGQWVSEAIRAALNNAAKSAEAA